MNYRNWYVISPELIKKVFLQPHPNDIRSLYEEPVFDWDIIVSLDLSFSCISEIAHLGLLSNLTILRLQQNRISRIQNLEMLIKLEYLDLGFNDISKIENLEKLTALTFLRLSGNKISVLENLEKNAKLETFHINTNQITDIEEIYYMKRFESLRNLDTRNNPFAVDDYRQLIINQLPELEYLDNKIVNDLERPTTLREKSPISKDIIDKHLRAAFLNYTDGKRYFDFLLEGQDYEDFIMLIDWNTEVKKAYEEYKIEMTRYAMEVQSICLKRLETRYQNDRKFRMEYLKFKSPRLELNRKDIKDYKKRKNKLIFRRSEVQMTEFHFQGEVSRLCDKLHKNNLYINTSIMKMIEIFEKIIGNEIETTIKELNDIFFNMNSIQEKFNQKFINLIEFSMGELDNIPEKCIKRFNDKFNITRTTHKIGEVIKIKIYKREKELNDKAQYYKKETVEGLKKKEKDRFWMVLEEIRAYKEVENDFYKSIFDFDKNVSIENLL